MEKFIGDRQTGKTSKLISLASQYGYILVEPNMKMADFAYRMAREKGYNIKVISAHQFLFNAVSRDRRKCLLDELDMCMDAVGVAGYSNGPDEYTESMRITMQSMMEGLTIIAGSKQEKITHCKDCIFGRPKLDALRQPCIECIKHPLSHTPDWYCADGKNKEESQNEKIIMPFSGT